MKGYLFLALLICSFPFMASAQSDVYYIPTKKVKTITRTNSNGEEVYSYNAKAVEKESTTAKYYNENRDVDEYNRRGGSSSDVTNQGSATEETNVEETPDNEDFKCTKHIIRFYSPRRGIMISSPYYWDICYDDVWDVYYDGWAYGLPSYAYWRYAYDPWYYNHWWYRSCWDFTWGWYDPWWGSYYWGWHHPLYWGWDRPYYGGWAFHYGGPHHYHVGWDHGYGRRSFGHFANNDGFRIGRPGINPANARVSSGGRNYRSMNNNNAIASNNNLSKSFRSGAFAGNSRSSLAGVNHTAHNMDNASKGAGYSRQVGGGGFSRNSTTSTTNSRSYTTGTNSNVNNVSRGAGYTRQIGSGGFSRNSTTSSSNNRNYTTGANGNRIYDVPQNNSRSGRIVGNTTSTNSRSNSSYSPSRTESNSRTYSTPSNTTSRSNSSYSSDSSSSRSSGSFGGGGFSRGGGSHGGGSFGGGGGSRGGGRR